MSFDYSQQVINDLEKALENDNEYDVVISVGKNENREELHANSNILRIRSNYFRTAFSDERTNKRDERFIFDKPNISPKLFKIILRFIYYGKIDCTKLKGHEVLELLLVADELKIQVLISCIQQYLINYHYSYLQQHYIEVLEKFDRYESLTDLRSFCLKKICENPKVLFNSDKFTNLKAPLLEQLLNRDDLGLDELVIWNSLLKWGLAQNPSISQDSTQWNNEEITTMKNTLHRFVPSVRFYHISSKDFLDKIYPLKGLLPEDLIKNILTFHMVPDRRSNIKISPPRKLNNKITSIIISLFISYLVFYIVVANLDKK